MQIVPIGSAPARLPSRSRTLLVRGGDVWLWPGIRLTKRRGRNVQPINIENARFWLTKLHGPEANTRPLSAILARAAELLNQECDVAAQTVLDHAGFERLSPEGAAELKYWSEAVGGVTYEDGSVG